jgi:hypothetical protein
LGKTLGHVSKKHGGEAKNIYYQGFFHDAIITRLQGTVLKPLWLPEGFGTDTVVATKATIVAFISLTKRAAAEPPPHKHNQ